MAGSIATLLSCLEQLQITTHMQLVNIAKPANSNMFFGYLLTMINIEPVNVDSFNYNNLNLD
jgi:hypothetical protein